MSSAVVLSVLPFLLQGAWATIFPPVVNAPPIPAPGVRTLDIAGQRFVPEDIQTNPPQFVIKEDQQFPSDSINEDQRWFISEGQPEENGEFVGDIEEFDRFYENGRIGPVATPIPDDAYVAQPSSTSKIIPEAGSNGRSSDVWVLTKGPNNQYVRERWVQIPSSRLVEVVNTDTSPKIIPEAVKSISAPPPPAQVVKSQYSPLPAPVPESPVQQIWMKAPNAAGNQKYYQNAEAVVEDIPPIKQYVDAPPPSIKQVVEAPPVKQVVELPPPNYKQIVEYPPPSYKQVSELPPQSYKQVVEVPPPSYKQVSEFPPQSYKQVEVPPPSYKQVVEVPPPSYKQVVELPPPSYKQVVEVPPPSYKQVVEVPQPNYKQVSELPLQSYKRVEVPPPNYKQYVELPPPNLKQVVDYPPASIKQISQPQITKDMYPPPPPPQVVQEVLSKKGTPFAVPPPPPPPLAPVKGTEFQGSKQYIPNTPPVGTIIQEKSGSVYVRDMALPALKHIWVPTSAQTGKFVSVPVLDAINKGKSAPSKGAVIEAPPPFVSDTWVLKQDGAGPRFEPQPSVVAGPAVQKGKMFVENQPIVQIESQKNPPIMGKSIDSVPAANIWPARRSIFGATISGKTPVPAPIPVPAPVPAYALKSQKSDKVYIGKGAPVPPVLPQNPYYYAGKSLPPPPPPPALLSPTVSLVNGKPCPIPPLKSYQPKGIPLTAVPRPVATIKRQPITRIIRVNRRPYGSYYVLNNRLRPSYYTYPRTANVLQQTKSGVIRLLPTNPVSVPVRGSQISLPLTKSPNSLLYPQMQAISRVRYAYPWGNYLRSYPLPGRSVYAIPQAGFLKGELLKSSSSESSSSESTASERKRRKKNKKESKKESKKEAKKEPKNEEKKEEPEEKEEKEDEKEEEEKEEVVEMTEPEEAASAEETGIENEEVEFEDPPENEGESEELAADSESNESIEVAESQLSPQIQKAPNTLGNAPEENLKPQPYSFGFEQRDSSGTLQHRKEVSDPDGRVTGEYGYTDQDIYRRVKYVADNLGFRVQVVSNEPGTVSHKSADADFMSNSPSESMTTSGRMTAATDSTVQEILTADTLRD